MKPRWLRHLQRVASEGYTRRPELTHNLEGVLETKKDEVEAFANRNVQTEYPGILRAKNMLFFHVDPELVRYYFAAVYYANSHYFQREVRTDRETIEISVSRSYDRATHRGRGLHTHEVRIPAFYFEYIPSLFAGVDSESRHTVHKNLLNDNGVDERQLASRAYRVVGETLDNGYAYRGEHLVSPQKDPFLNDFTFVKGETNGHNAAAYIS